MTLPFYDLEPEADIFADDDNLPDDSRYAPIFGLSLGVGWRPQPRVTIF